MRRLPAVLAALIAAALIGACGGSPQKTTPTALVRPELPPRTTTKPQPKPEKRAKATTKQTQNGPIAAPVPPFDGPIVKVRVKDDLCAPETVAAPAGEAFQLQVRSVDHTYSLIFDSRSRLTVPAHSTVALKVGPRKPDEPVLSNGGEPCAVIRVGK